MVKKNQIFHFYRNFGQRLTTYWFLWFWQRSKFFLHQITYPKFFIHFFQQLCLLKTKIYTVKYIKKFLLQFSNRSSVKFQYFIESYCIYVPQSNFISCSLPAGLHFQHFSTIVFFSTGKNKAFSITSQLAHMIRYQLPPLSPPLPVSGNIGIATLIIRTCSQVTFLEA